MSVKASYFTSHLAVYSKAYQYKQPGNHQSSTLLAICAGNPMVTNGFPAQRASIAKLQCRLCKMESAHITISSWHIFLIWYEYVIELDSIIIISVTTCHCIKHGNYTGRAYSIFLKKCTPFCCALFCFVYIISSWYPFTAWISNYIHLKCGMKLLIQS